MRKTDERQKNQTDASIQNPTVQPKRISIQEARKYFRKKDHSAFPLTFWHKPRLA
ncbi:MAG: hypothetical protein HY584_00365 [Candidatus Omnitrophica bacterium]|nr:hypothetical protein [Candidatus Omnitrophota bacterium]